MRWGTEALFSPEAMVAAQPVVDAAPQQQPAAVKADGDPTTCQGNGAAPMEEDGAEPDAASADADAAGTTAGKDTDAASVPAPAPPLSEPALQQLVAIADEVHKSGDWRLTAPSAAGSAQPSPAPDSATNGRTSGMPKLVTGLGAGLEAAAAREWQSNECEEEESSDAGASFVMQPAALSLLPLCCSAQCGTCARSRAGCAAKTSK